MFGRTSGFGTQSTSFGFGSNPPSTFGPSNQLFGSTSGGFNSTAPVFGSNTQPMFGSTPSTATPLFGTSNTSTFGQPNQSGFGSSLFGSSGQPSSSGIFGSSSTNTFGQQNKTTGFGFPSSTGGGLFSQSSQPNQQNASVFQSSSSSGLFGSSNSFGSNTGQMGTVIKFVPVTGTDSVQKSGIVQSINTKHHCITCMKEYEGKSLEELRYEDYQRKNKDIAGQQPFGQPQPFGISSTSSSIFGQPDKSTFGSPRTDFGTSTFGMSTQTTTPNIFGKSTTGFGAPTSTSTFPFATNTSSSGLFGSSTAAKSFAAPTNQIFGASQPQQNTFGNVFGQTANQTSGGGIFGKPNATGFNTSQSGFTFGNQQPAQTSLFQTPKPNTGFGIFGQSNAQAPAFGQQQQQPSFGLNSTFGKPAQPTFGQSTQSTFGTQSIFGNTQNKPLFGNTTGTSLFGNTFQQNTPFQLNTQQQQQTPSFNQLDTQSQELRALVQLTDPYGYNKHLEGLSPIKPSTAAYVTNPKDLQKLLESPPPIAVVSPMNKRLQVLPISAKKTNLFDEMFDRETPEVNFTLRSSARRLVINKNRSIEADEIPQISLLEPQDLVDTNNAVKTTPSTTKLDIVPAPADKYNEKRPEVQDSITSLMSINTNLMKNNTQNENISINLSGAGDQQPEVQTSTKDDQEKSEIIEKMIDTCGVKLTRPEYYTIPPIEKLFEHKQSDGQCLVKGFTIGRVAYGNVCFPDLMDISNLDLDELVHFRYREVTIYPNDIKKPPQGEGLNRRAQVTLDRVYPKSKMDRKLITDIDMLISINFSDTLRDLCEKHGTKFLDYRPETGSWVFMVDHFSKYGFSDSEEEEATDRINKQQKLLNGKVVIENKSKSEIREIKGDGDMKRDKIANEEELLKRKLMEEMQVDEDLFDVDMGIEEDSLGPHGASIENIDFDYTSIPDPREMHPLHTRTSMYGGSSDNIFFMKASLYVDHFESTIDPIEDEDEDQDYEVISNESLNQMLKVTPLRRPPSPKRPTIKPRTFTLQYNVSFNCSHKTAFHERNYMDAVIFKGSSFKVGWGRGLVLISKFVESPLNSPDSGIDLEDPPANTIQIANMSGFEDFDPFMNKLEQHLQVVLDTSDIVMENHNVPLFTIRHGKTPLLRHQLLARETAKDYPKCNSVLYYQQIWNLCAAFWGPMSRPTKRRDLFSTWLEECVESSMQDDLNELELNGEDALYEKIFLNLTGNRIIEAAELAADNELYNLSLLLSQLNSSKATKSITNQQLDYWKTSLTVEHVHPTLQKIYMLISGQNIGGTTNLNTMEPINVCDKLDWKRCLAIMLWYIASSGNNISTALELYREDFEETGFSAKPIPYYSNQENTFDLLYHLMLLQCGRGKPLESVLEPETHSMLPTDYRLSWMLLHTLQSLQIGTIGIAAKTFMTTSLSQQLETLGLYKWAVFVLLFIEDINLRKNSIMGILYRNIRQDEEDRYLEDEIVTELCVPPEWIHEVKGYKSNMLSYHWEAYKHFTNTGDWAYSHEVALSHIIPELIVNDHFDLVGYILRDIETGCRSIMNWDTEGGLLVMFLDLYDKFQEKEKFSGEEAMSVHSLLARVAHGVTKFPFNTAAQFAGIAQVAKYCNFYRKLLLTQIQPISYPIQLSPTQINEIEMPPDYQLDDMGKTRRASETSFNESAEFLEFEEEDVDSVLMN